ncbi:MAG: proline--tRNA ligase [Leptospira sp.]|nr:proline--tRNA ligase [Leptospira sp.]
MKASQYLIPTTKDDPQDAVVASHKLMMRAGLVRKSGAGLYHYLPLGLKILKKIESIIREEMDSSGALEFQLPILTPSDLWKESGRWDKMGKEMFRLKDRHDNENCLGPTHEESFCSLMKPMLRSYKDLPINVYQIHTKFRDEIRPRFGVIRSREFTMKDAYSFHLDDASLEETYQLMRQTYRKIFQRMGLTTIPVQADSGNMGGSASEEFMVVSPIGEETLMLCDACGYNGNIEKTPLVINSEKDAENGTYSQGVEVSTPNAKSIEDVAKLLNVDTHDCIKALALVVDGIPNIVFIPGDRELNEAKFKNATSANESRPMGNAELEKYNLIAGFIGADQTFHKDIRVWKDASLSHSKKYVTGYNKVDFHIQDYVGGDKWSDMETADLVMTRRGDACPNCGKPMDEEKGIEVGHIFQLGKKYAESFDIKVLDDKGKPQVLTMGCYGIGVNRCMATVIEQCNDDKGIYWPISIAPFEICMVSIAKAPEDIARIEGIYNSLKSKGFDILWDNRDMGPGFKFKDAELIGYPIRLTLGKGFLEKGEISIMNRKSGEEILHDFKDEESLSQVISGIRERLYEELKQ